MSSLLIVNLGGLITGDLANPLRTATSIYIEDGVIAEIDSRRSDADTIIDANGLLATPGLIDTHVHPTFGDFTPTQNSVGWMQAYLHGGVTSLVSAGELHVPGLPLDPPDAQLFKYLAVLARKCSQNLPWPAPRLFGGTLLLAPGLEEGDFDEIAGVGIGCVKFIFYPYGDNDAEADNYVRWCKERDIVVKIHSGGVSRSGVSRPAGLDVVRQIRPDIVGHIAGGPIPMPRDEMTEIVTTTDAYLEIATGGSFKGRAQPHGDRQQRGRPRARDPGHRHAVGHGRHATSDAPQRSAPRLAGRRDARGGLVHGHGQRLRGAPPGGRLSGRGPARRSAPDGPHPRLGGR